MEELSNLNIAVTSRTAAGVEDVGRIAYLAHSFDFFMGNVQKIGTTPEALMIVPGVPTFIYINNTGSSLLIVDSLITMDAFPQRLIPGGSVVLSPETGLIYIKSSTEDGNAWVMSVH